MGYNVQENQKLPKKLVDNAWREMMRRGDLRADGLLEVNTKAFVEFYTTHMFSNMVQEVKKADDENLTLELSREHGIDVMQLDRIKKRFDEFDVDKSGYIDYEEFLSLLAHVMKARDPDDIAESTVRRMWQEIDSDGSGEVDFPEFTTWYVKYFGSNDDGSMDMSKCPVENFYDSFNPAKHRSTSKT